MTTTTLEIGSPAPDFNLPAVDGNIYSLYSFKDSEALVVIFNCNHCPYVQAYENRIIELQKEYKDKGVSIVAVNANDTTNYPDDSFDKMIERAKKKRFNFPYLRDEEQITASAFGATHTPEVFLFNKERKLVYHGKIDDNWQEPEKVRNQYLKNAIDELLKGKEISVPETYSIGCTIKWKV
ncbi:MAG: alkyl hydroperoxide reductase [Ignavibacteria bacterium RBG_16_34_14]|nr:MAG: alkyl hydroperoxide reductase [Ignavibacteria bacterium RBG_16_34_14]